MQLVVNEQQQIIAYSVLGNIAGSVAYDGTVPDDFAINFVPNLYLLQSNMIVKNPDYVAPTVSPEAPTVEQQALTVMAQQVADQQQHIVSIEKALTALAQGGAKS
ncbi:DUF2977 domain-containing protein [Lactiplantibacillus paraplantarum]|uniref:DUF2977 domain-containing protein n=1 Tax=Lactiplantibacillus paraplantarum TaxID=60520 RepID=UPI002551D7F2|nr:DUF2977 domain-containing protein [Lactiplantibacillus paraplantarum]MDL2061563.1 DUF2977 domain-containing protein [Lactiplantibacillus paraplantarum]